MVSCSAIRTSFPIKFTVEPPRLQLPAEPKASSIVYTAVVSEGQFSYLVARSRSCSAGGAVFRIPRRGSQRMQRRPVIGITTQTLQSIDRIPEDLPESWVMNQR